MLPLDKYPSFAEDLFTFKFVKIFEANQKILHKISTLLLRNEKYRVNKFAKSNQPTFRIPIPHLLPPPEWRTRTPKTRIFERTSVTRRDGWPSSLYRESCTSIIVPRSSLVFYTFDPERVPRTIETRGSGDFLGYCWRRDRKRTRNGDV